MFRSAVSYVIITLVFVPPVFLVNVDVTPQIQIRNNKSLQAPSTAVNYEVNVRANVPIHVTDDRFLSVAVDVNTMNRNWGNFSFSSTKLHTLTRALSPAYLRLGGTAQDFLLFKSPCDLLDVNKTHIMCPEDWNGINKFCSDTGLKLIFGLNLLLRTEDGQWDPTNAEELLDYNTYEVAWELGNEPNSYKKKDNISLSGSQIGHDFNLLRAILQNRSKYAGASVFGPDVGGVLKTKQRHILNRFLSTTNATNATTFHSYYMNGRTATSDDFLDPEIYKSLWDKINLVNSIVAKFYPKGRKVWLGETGSAFGGGAKNLSDRYVAGFLFLDKLGMSASMGLDVVIRQAYYGGNYTMLDLENLEPKPDYWSTYIYKYLVGSKVLRVETNPVSYRMSMKEDNDEMTDKKYLRVYAQCTATSQSGYDAGAVTLLILNIHKTDSANITLLRKLSGRTVDQYLLTPHGLAGMTSSQVNLNGRLLQLVNDTTFPQIKPIKIKRGNPLILPPLTYGFYVIPKAKAKACISQA